MSTVVIVGATSPIAEAVAWRFSAAGFDLVLAARQTRSLLPLAGAIENQNAVNVEVEELDAFDAESVDSLIDRFESRPPDVVISLLGRQEDSTRSPSEAAYLSELVQGNFVAPALILERFGEILKGAGCGTLVGVSSVVGDRGRSRNYPYGAAKAGFNAYLSGLRQRLTPSTVHVMTVKPGVVSHPTRESRHPAWLLTTPESVARSIFEGWQRQRSVIYTPWFWRWIMFIVRVIPEPLFRRMTF